MKFATAILIAGLMLTGAAPSQAQSFGIFFGDEPEDFVREGLPSPFGGFDRKTYPESPLCLTDRGVRQAIADLGYSDISLNVPNERRVQVRATRDGSVWLLYFNLCSKRIEASTQLRPAR
jgi:hypothetical protein